MITKNIRVDYETWKKVKMFAAENELPIGTVVSDLINKELCQKNKKYLAQKSDHDLVKNINE
jgi:uncharacterized protein YejL (UPF0352 family)